MKLTASAKVGITVAILVLVFLSIMRGKKWGLEVNLPILREIPWLSGFAGEGPYVINLSAVSVKGLAPGADVQLNGNRIGQVGDITNEGLGEGAGTSQYSFGGVNVQLLIESNWRVHEHATFTITREGLFGAYFVSIDEPRSGRMLESIRDGQVWVAVERGKVDAGGPVVRAGKVVGRVISVEPYYEMDKALLKLDDPSALDETMAFVPVELSAEGPVGVAAYAWIPPDAKVQGMREPGPEDLIIDLDRALAQVSSEVSLVMSQVSSVLETVGGLLDKEKVQTLLDMITREASLIADRVASLTSRLDTILAENQPHINRTMQNVEEITASAKTVMEGFSQYSDPEMKEKIDSITANLAEATESLARVLEDLEGLTSDEELLNEIRNTVTQARATLEQAGSTLRSADEAIQEAREKVSAMGNIEAQADFTLRCAPEPDRWISDVEARVGMGDSDLFFVAGLNDIGETERVDAQVGYRITPGASASFGVCRGKIGASAQWENDRFMLLTDIYDPNNPTWNLYGNYWVLPDLGIVVGVDDVFDENEASVGLRFQF